MGQPGAFTFAGEFMIRWFQVRVKASEIPHNWWRKDFKLSRCPVILPTVQNKLAWNLICVLPNLKVQCVVLQILCFLFTSSLSASLFLLQQTCHCLAKHAECSWAHWQTTWGEGWGSLNNSSWQLDSITPTRESFVRDSFKVGFSTLYFPSTWAQTLPKHLLQQSHYDPKGLGHKLLKFERRCQAYNTLFQ